MRLTPDPRHYAIAVLAQAARVRSPSPDLVRAVAELVTALGHMDTGTGKRLSDIEADIARISSVVKQLDTLNAAERALFGGG